MASVDTASVTKRTELPAVRHIGLGDLTDALRQGLADFIAAPTHAIFLGLVYPVVGLLLFRATFHYEIIPLLFPIVAGFAILGPFVRPGRHKNRGLPRVVDHRHDRLAQPRRAHRLAHRA